MGMVMTIFKVEPEHGTHKDSTKADKKADK